MAFLDLQMRSVGRCEYRAPRKILLPAIQSSASEQPRLDFIRRWETLWEVNFDPSPVSLMVAMNGPQAVKGAANE
jgi:hypothetical protein